MKQDTTTQNISTQSISKQNSQRLTLRPREAAKAIGVSERTLRSLIRSGEIPHAKLDRAVLIPIAGLEAFIASKIEEVETMASGERLAGGQAAGHAGAQQGEGGQ